MIPLGPRNPFDDFEFIDEHKVQAPTHEEFVRTVEPIQIIENYAGADLHKGINFIRLSVMGRRFRVIGICEEEVEEEFDCALDHLVERVVRNQDLEPLVDPIAFRTFVGDYTHIETVKFVLGEELFQDVIGSMPIRWRITSENVPRLHQYIQFQFGPLEDRYLRGNEATLAASKEILKKEKAKIIEKFKKFDRIQDYILEDRDIVDIIPLTKRTLEPWPRIERLKIALSQYFQIENCLRNREIQRHVHDLMAFLGEDELEAIAEAFETGTERENLELIAATFPSPKLTADERLSLIEAMRILFSPLNQFLLEGSGADFNALEKTALQNLEKVCQEVGLQVIYRQNGKDLYLGGHAETAVDLDAYCDSILDDDEDDFVKAYR
jgi:hypothetical protein